MFLMCGFLSSKFSMFFALLKHLIFFIHSNIKYCLGTEKDKKKRLKSPFTSTIKAMVKIEYTRVNRPLIMLTRAW